MASTHPFEIDDERGPQTVCVGGIVYEVASDEHGEIVGDDAATPSMVAPSGGLVFGGIRYDA